MVIRNDEVGAAESIAESPAMLVREEEGESLKSVEAEAVQVVTVNHSEQTAEEIYEV